jgi:hypothetical protein
MGPKAAAQKSATDITRGSGRMVTLLGKDAPNLSPSVIAKLMVFKLIMEAAKTWRRLNGEKQLPKVIEGVRFRDGIEVIETPSQNAA